MAMAQAEEVFGKKLECLCAENAALAQRVRWVVEQLGGFSGRPLDKELGHIADDFGGWRTRDGTFPIWLAGLRLRHGSNRGIVAVFVCEHAGDHDVLERDVTAVFKQCAEGGGAKHQYSEMETDQALA